MIENFGLRILTFQWLSGMRFKDGYIKNYKVEEISMSRVFIFGQNNDNLIYVLQHLKNGKEEGVLIVGDALEVLKIIPDNSIDMIITSPPYDNLREYYDGFKWNFEIFSEIAKELVRVLKDGRVIVWITSDATINCSETGSSFKQVLFFMELGLKLHDTMIFKKVNPIPQVYRKRYTNEFEFMFVLSKGCVEVHNPIMVKTKHAGLELKSTTYKNFSLKEQKRKKPANPVKEYKIKGNVWEYVVGVNKEDKEAKFHPAPFPLQLAIDHILSWSNEGDVILDPFCGSGTSCVAAKILKRKYIGIDISKEYIMKATDRIRRSDEFKGVNTSYYRES